MHEVFAAAGPLADAYAATDWDVSPVGRPETWSAAMRGALEVVLHSRYPAALLWGEEFVQVYNAAYVELIGEKHPHALGRPTRESFGEVWGDLGPMMQGVRDGAGAVLVEDSLVPLVRRGFLEECWFTFCYSPVHGADGRVEGLVDIANETTHEVLANRRLRLLAQLASVLAEAQSPEALLLTAATVLRGHPDLPRVDLRVSAAADPERAALHGLPVAPSRALPGHDVLVEEPDAATGRGRVAWLPLEAVPDQTVPGAVLVVGLSEALPLDEDYLSFLRLVASSLSQALQRLDALRAERLQATRERQFSATLQRSLLTVPQQRAGLELAVRYRAAAHEAQVGGDWYDAFDVDEDVVLAVGDVAGHDRDSAAGMAQIRGLLRGIAYTGRESPGHVLASLDEAIAGLDVDAVATAVLAKVAPAAAGRTDVRRLVLANAGHLPPVLLRADGSVELVEDEPELMLGVHPGSARTDRVVELGVDDAVLLYTDGLVERRDASLDQSLAWLVGTVADQHHRSAESLCDHLLELVGSEVDDDVALLVVRHRGA